MEERAGHLSLYTVGYGNCSIDEFGSLPRRYEIHYVVGLRSQPYSRFHPKVLNRPWRRQHIRSIFPGKSRAARQQDASCYVKCKADYALRPEKLFYWQGIQCLHTARERQARTALTRSEQKPQECHRSKLIGHMLRQSGIANSSYQ